MQAIYTQTVTSTAGVNITFNNIPQNYTDLLLSCSVRFAGNNGDAYLTFNNDTAGLASSTYLQGTSGGPYTGRMTGNYGVFIGQISGSSSTANTFSGIDILIPSYSSNIFKTSLALGARENNSNTDYTTMPSVGLWRANAPITSMYLYGLAQHSRVTLYGISR